MTTTKEMKLWQDDMIEQLQQLVLLAPEDNRSMYAEWAEKCELASRVIHYKIKTYVHRGTIERLLKAFGRVPAKHPYSSRPPRKTRTAKEEALMVYGTPQNAIARLNSQLDMADDLGLDQLQRNRISSLVCELEAAA